MTMHDGAAGEAAVEYLIEQGKLVSDFWLRSEAMYREDDSPDAYRNHAKQVASAVQFAMGRAGVELPEWASPMRDAPDCVWVYPDMLSRYPRTETYYGPDSLFRALSKCDGSVNPDTRQGARLRRDYINLAWRSWHRLVPHFSVKYSQELLDIENERGNNGHTFSKAARRDNIISGIIIRDTPLYEFYREQGEDGLKKVFHGIGQKAILGVGAMLFLSGEHDDLLPSAEKLEDLLATTKLSQK